ncbi:MAG: helix-turn-helix domain-containing protein [Candidatus Fimenecus sp.]
MFSRKEMGQKIGNLRKQSGMSQTELGNKLGYQQSDISRIEKGNKDLTFAALADIAQLFNVSADYLLGLSGAKTNDKDLQIVCDYTGFSEEIVIRLKELKDFLVNDLNDDFYYDYLNSVIVPLTGKIFADVEVYDTALTQFFEFVESSIINFKNKDAFINMSVAESTHKRIEFGLKLSQIKEKYENLEFKKFKLQTSFGAAIDTILDKKPFTASLLYDEACDEYVKAMALLKKDDNAGDINGGNTKA